MGGISAQSGNAGGDEKYRQCQQTAGIWFARWQRQM